MTLINFVNIDLEEDKYSSILNYKTMWAINFGPEEKEFKTTFLWKHLLKFTQCKDEATPFGEIVMGKGSAYIYRNEMKISILEMCYQNLGRENLCYLITSISLDFILLIS